MSIVDHFEGSKIRPVTISATSALDLFMDDSVATPRFQTEDVAKELLQLLPRTSPDTHALFANVSLGAGERDFLVNRI